MAAEVTIGLCIKNSGATVETALDSILKQDYSHKALKVIIVDENEEGAALPYIESFKKETDIKTTVFFVENKGLGASRQIVIDNSEGDYVVWVDDDFVLRKDFITKHVEFMNENPQLAAAAAVETPILTNFLSSFEAYFVSQNTITKNVPLGGLEIFRLEAVNQIGGYDVSIKGAAEDQDISLRLINSGWKLAINDGAEYYRKCRPATWKATWSKNFWYGYGKHLLYHKHKSSVSIMEIFLPAAFWTGLRISLKLYRFNREKKVFLLPTFYSYMRLAWGVGFFYSNVKKYGH
jgi:glycosyltransferase involved in cell wall biosynthesis